MYGPSVVNAGMSVLSKVAVPATKELLRIGLNFAGANPMTASMMTSFGAYKYFDYNIPY